MSKYHLGTALILALLSTVGCYFYWNARFTYGYGDKQIKKISATTDILLHSTVEHDEVVAVNVSYDRMLVPYYSNKIPAGDIDITDRQKLLSFLDSLSIWDNYRYILCDVSFDRDVKSAFDDSLFRKIASMQRIVIPSSGNGTDPEILAEKVVTSEYSQLFTGSGFKKYNYLTRGGFDSIALRMWKEIDGGNFNKWGPFYTSNGNLCVNSLIPDLEFHPQEYDGERKVILNLGKDILEVPYNISPTFNDKIVIIGDWLEFDFHDTIRGRMCGSAIIYNAYLALKRSDHCINWWIILFTIIILAIEWGYALRPLFSKSYTFRSISKNRRTMFGKAVILASGSLLGFQSILFIFSFIIYLCYHVFVNVIIIGALISFLYPFIKLTANR